jgi:hypothetical protein
MGIYIAVDQECPADRGHLQKDRVKKPRASPPYPMALLRRRGARGFFCRKSHSHANVLSLLSLRPPHPSLSPSLGEREG